MAARSVLIAGPEALEMRRPTRVAGTAAIVLGAGASGSRAGKDLFVGRARTGRS